MGWTESFGARWANNIPVIWGLSPISTPRSHFQSEETHFTKELHLRKKRKHFNRKITVFHGWFPALTSVPHRVCTRKKQFWGRWFVLCQWVQPWKWLAKANGQNLPRQWFSLGGATAASDATDFYWMIWRFLLGRCNDKSCFHLWRPGMSGLFHRLAIGEFIAPFTTGSCSQSM